MFALTAMEKTRVVGLYIPTRLIQRADNLYQ